jgi:hypothetical protein
VKDAAATSAALLIFPIMASNNSSTFLDPGDDYMYAYSLDIKFAYLHSHSTTFSANMLITQMHFLQ